MEEVAGGGGAPPHPPPPPPPSSAPRPPLTPSDVGALLSMYAKPPYDTRETIYKTQQILSRCQELMELDYKCLVIPNPNGELCSSYPNQLFIPECERAEEEEEEEEAKEEVPRGSSHPSTSTPPSHSTTHHHHHHHHHPSPLTLASPSPLFNPPSFSSVVVRGVGGGGGGGGGIVSPDPLTDGFKLRDLILKAKFARCRARFPVPVILYKGNYICRSSTLAGGPEMYGRSGIEYLLTAATSGKAEEEVEEEEDPSTSTSTSTSTSSTSNSAGVGGGEWQLFDKVRSQDIRLLKACSVGVIVDLMVEKKKVKYGLNVTSSEKVDKENRYGAFSILSLPYPGCEFFREFRDAGYSADGMTINWNHTFMDAHLVIPERSHARRVASDWNAYRKWDLIRLTQNYLHLLLLHAQEGSEGLLVHCISGWDRTPLFISLLRLSLWADGLIHPSLGPLEILYLTIAYDWLLFGHDLKDRLAKGEEIFFFCFDFLKYITTEEFSLDTKRNQSTASTSDGSTSGGGGCTSTGRSSTNSSTTINNNNNTGSSSGLLLLLDGDGLSPAGSSTSLTSSCSSNRSFPILPPRYFRADAPGLASTAHLTWPYGSDTSDLDLDDFSPRLSRASSASSTKGLSGRVRDMDVDVTRQTASWTREPRNLSESSESSGLTDENKTGVDEFTRASTSPVAVPVPRSRMNQPSQRIRNESLSSVGSWQIITTTGSLKGSSGLSAGSSASTGGGGGGGGGSAASASAAALPATSAAAVSSATPHGSAGSRASVSSCFSMGSELVDSACTIKGVTSGLGRSASEAEKVEASKRPEKLAKVRSLFYNQYVTSIGFSACNGRHDSGLGTLVSNFAQKVGIRPGPNRGT